MLQINIQYFLNDESKFPWEIMELSRPSYGSVWGYIAEIAAKYLCEYQDARFYSGRPSLTEIRKRAKSEKDLLAPQIVSFMDRVNSNSEGKNVAYWVLEFLKERSVFVEKFQERIEQLYRNKTISVPKAALIKQEKVFASWQ